MAQQLADAYGNVFCIRLGRDTTVFVSGYKMVKEALVTQAENFMDRPDNPMQLYNAFPRLMKSLPGPQNAIFSLLKSLEAFIRGEIERHKVDLDPNNSRDYIDTFLMEEKLEENREVGFYEGNLVLCCLAQNSLQNVTVFSGRPFNPHYILKSAVGNVISAVVFGHRFEYSDEGFQNLLRLDNEAVLLAGTARAQLYDAFPGLLNYLPGPHQTIHSNYRKIVAFLQMEIQKHQEEWNPEDPQDYIDTYLAEIEKRKGDPHAGFNTETLTICTLDLFEAGTETAATTLRWALVFMMNYPEIQEKVQAEIDRVIGQSRQPTIADRPNLPYTDAVNHETQRMGNIVPLGFPKMAGKDATLGGYFIPKGTAISVNLSSVLFDKNEWETPDTFNPEHFLDSEGQFRRREAFLPFSAGKRACLDEHLARMELFVFFASLLQLFTFTPVPGEMPSLEGVMGFTYSPEEFKILAMPR
ncbi:cytochrome P450 2J2-like [Myripristis murdjan]|uniref:cytochrome P450 2J2-like n=1 Tax=Myripristis murdjan TaxID=586833 RepID=UPI00117648C5|nr:cytochrome P450 2J2-like [Myripristis murdjan]